MLPWGACCLSSDLLVSCADLSRPYQGGQAQYLRVPYADFNALILPPGTEHEADFAMLADIFPTGWHGLAISGFKSGESVAVFGAGPVGLMAAVCTHPRLCRPRQQTDIEPVP